MKISSLWTSFRLRFLPRSLWWRFFTILVAPVIIIVSVSSTVFFDTHWQSVSHRLADNVTDDIRMIMQALDHMDPADAPSFLNGVNETLGYTFIIGPAQKKFYNRLSQSGIWKTSELRPLLKKMNIPFTLQEAKQEKSLKIIFFRPDFTLEVVIPYKLFFSSTIYVFGLWTLCVSLVFVVIASIFMRNQIRPIVSLAEAAENFGLGRDATNFKPAGASEVRRAASSFLKMRDRIRRYIDERTQMLAGISHDLRTPLTRMRLQLAMMGDNEDCRELLNDVEEMERMVNGYLAFVKGEDAETAVSVDLNDFLEQAAAPFKKSGTDIRLRGGENVSLTVRQNAFKRCIDNLLSNAQRYARHVDISFTRKDKFVEIAIEDDGPGIPKEKREDVFKAFYRLDESRNLETGGVGLGLSITKDIVLSHGGTIFLDDSTLGGLKVVLRMPTQ